MERKSKLTRLRKLVTKAAAEMKDNTIELLAPLAARVHTLTVDNGKEFCEHERITAALQARIYFAHPYASWERGLNENTNGLVRQYFPKKYDFARITDQDLQQVEDRLNNRPRKTLGYRTPNEVFFKQRYVALQVESAQYKRYVVCQLSHRESNSKEKLGFDQRRFFVTTFNQRKRDHHVNAVRRLRQSHIDDRCSRHNHKLLLFDRGLRSLRPDRQLVCHENQSSRKLFLTDSHNHQKI